MGRNDIKDKTGEVREVDVVYYKVVVEDMGLPTDDENLPAHFIYPEKQTCGFFKEEGEKDSPEEKEKAGNLRVYLDKLHKCILLVFPVPTRQYTMNLENAKTLVSILNGSIDK